MTLLLIMILLAIGRSSGLKRCPFFPPKKGDTNRAEDDADDDGKKQRASPSPLCGKTCLGRVNTKQSAAPIVVVTEDHDV